MHCENRLHECLDHQESADSSRRLLRSADLRAALCIPGLELDEAEQVLWTQDLSLGYGTQPPLYTWLQWLVFKVFGVSVFSLSLLKNVLLACTYGFVWAAARRWLSPALAVLAAASMLLIPQIGWESQRDLTHSVLATAVAAATVFVLIRLIETPKPLFYVLLGACAALGLLSKYSFALYLAALVIATAGSAQTRAILCNSWLWLSVVAAALLLLPHGLWLLDHWHLASVGTMEKLSQAPVSGNGITKGLSRLTQATMATIGALCLVYLSLFGRLAWATHDGTHVHRPICSFWRRYFLALTALLVALVLFFGVTHFKGRWLQPMLFVVPFAFFCCRTQLAHHARLTWLKVALSVFAVLYLTLAAFRPILDGWRDRPDELNEPVVELTDALLNAGYRAQTPIVTDNAVLGGVLRTRFPEVKVVIWKSDGPLPAELHGPHLLIGRQGGGEALFKRAGRSPDARLTLSYVHAKPGHPPVEYRYALVD